MLTHCHELGSEPFDTFHQRLQPMSNTTFPGPTPESTSEIHIVNERVVQMKTVSFPPSVSRPSVSNDLTCQTSIVVVGANGAGKSRLGAWLETEGPQKAKIHRISAQRSLVFPEGVGPTALQSAREAFHWVTRPMNWDLKTFEQNRADMRLQERYGGKAGVSFAPVNDYQKLVTLLFSENYEALLRRESREAETGQLMATDTTLLRQVKALWESVLPNRRLVIGSGDIRAQPLPLSSEVIPAPYPAKAMSDGERVIFYLIGQCLCAPLDSIILIDEPEIHLHKAIQDALWDSIEKHRPDCTFVYLTHDLTFAADRIGATKVCLKEISSDNQFNWFPIDRQEGIPDEVYLEVLGSRKPILFVEGDAGSPDFELYQLAFPRFMVKPIGGCADVLSATKSFRDLQDLHRLQCFGIVDRDHLQAGQLTAYERKGIFTPKVAEVENLYLIPELITAAASQLMLEEKVILSRVKTFVIDMFKRRMASHAMDVMRQRVTLTLGQFSSSSDNVEAFDSDFREHLDTIDCKVLYNEALTEAQAMIDASDYLGILRVFNNKGIAESIAHLLELRQGTYIQKIREMSKRGLGDVPRHLRTYLPDLDSLLLNQGKDVLSPPAAS
jgi:hypothetical protein